MSSPFQQKFAGKSPLLQGAYESAADNAVVISNQPAIDAMFNVLGEVGAAAVKANADPDNRAKRQEKRVARRGKRADKKGDVGTKKRDNFDITTGEIKQRAIVNRKEGKAKRLRDRPTHNKAGNLIDYKEEQDTTVDTIFRDFNQDGTNPTVDLTSFGVKFAKSVNDKVKLEGLIGNSSTKKATEVKSPYENLNKRKDWKDDIIKIDSRYEDI